MQEKKPVSDQPTEKVVSISQKAQHVNRKEHVADNLLSKYGLGKNADTETGKTEYKAFEASRTETRQLLEVRQGRKGHSVDYKYLRNIVYQLDIDPQEIELYMSMVRFTIYGRNLDELKDRLHTHAVHWLEPFDPDKHLAPAPNAAFIEEITTHELEARKD